MRCESCGYAANVEAARVGAAPEGRQARRLRAHRHVASTTPGATPSTRSWACSTTPGSTASRTLKSIAAIDDKGEVLVVLVPGDREAKLPRGWSLLDPEDFAPHPCCTRGFLGPVGLDVGVVADASVAAADDAVGRRAPTSPTRTSSASCSVATSRPTTSATTCWHARATACPRLRQGLELVRSCRGGAHLPARPRVLRRAGRLRDGGRHLRRRGRDRPAVLDGLLRLRRLAAHRRAGRDLPRRARPVLAGVVRSVRRARVLAGRGPHPRGARGGRRPPRRLARARRRRALRRPRRLGRRRVRRRGPPRRPSARDGGIDAAWSGASWRSRSRASGEVVELAVETAAATLAERVAGAEHPS